MPTQTATPVAFALAGTPIAKGQPITSQNAKYLTQFARWGSGIPTNLAVSQDGDFIAVPSTSGLHLFDAKTLQMVRTLAPGLLLRSAAFSPDGIFLAMGSQSGEIILFTRENLEVKHQASASNAAIHSLAFSHDSSMIACTTANREVIIYGSETGDVLRTISLPLSAIGNTVFSADDTTVALWQGRKTIASFNLKNGKQVQEIYVPNNSRGDPANGGVISLDGTLAAANTGSQIRIYNVVKGITLHLLNEVDEQVSWSGVSAYGSSLSVVDGSTLKTWDLKTADILHERPIPAGMMNIRQAHITADGAYLAVITDCLHLLHLSDPGKDRTAENVNFSTDLRLVTAFNDKNNSWNLWHMDGTQRSFSAVDGTLIEQFRLNDKNMSIVSYNTALDVTAVNFESPIISLYRQDSVEPAAEFTMSSNVTSLALDARDTALAACDAEANLQVWSLDNSELIAEETLPSPARQMTYSGDRLLAQTVDRLLVLNSSTLQIIHEFPGYASASSPDGEVAAVAGGLDQYGTAIYDLGTGKLITTLPDQGVYMAFSSDNSLLAVSGDVIRLWEIESGRYLNGLTTGGAGFGQVLFSPDTSLLAYSPWDGGFIFWGVP